MKKSRIIATVLIATFFIAGAVEAIWPTVSLAVLAIHMFTVSFLSFWWFGEHASENGLAVPPMGSRILTAFITPIGLPYYFYRAYGFQAGTIKLLLLILLFVLSLALYLILFYVVSQFST